MYYVYPAEFIEQDDGSYVVDFHDLLGCSTEGRDLENAMYMAQEALELWLTATLEDGLEIPASSGTDAKPEEGGFMTLVRAGVRDTRSVARTLSLPKWLADKAAEAHLSLSKVLQEALKDRLGVS